MTKVQNKKLRRLVQQRGVSIERGTTEFECLNKLSDLQAEEMITFLERNWDELKGMDFCERVKELQKVMKFGIPVDKWRAERGIEA